MGDQTSPEEEITLENISSHPTDSGVSISVISEDPLKPTGHKLNWLNGSTIPHTVPADDPKEPQYSPTPSSSLQDGLEKTELMLTAGNPLGLSSVSLEVMTSGEQLNLLAEGLDSPAGSVCGQVVEEEERKKMSKDCPSISNVPGGVDSDAQSECLRRNSSQVCSFYIDEN